MTQTRIFRMHALMFAIAVFIDTSTSNSDPLTFCTVKYLLFLA